MASIETRKIDRDSLLLMASVRAGRFGPTWPVKVRNLSANGMMGEGELPAERGAQVIVELKNIGAVAGSVAWVQGNRFGVAFADAIDPKLARSPVRVGAPDLASPRYTRPPLASGDGRLRAI
jgi:hypothetical protein